MFFPSKVSFFSLAIARDPVMCKIQSGQRCRSCSINESCAKRACLTRRAADGGYAPRYFGNFLALGFVHFDSESTLTTHRQLTPIVSPLNKVTMQFMEKSPDVRLQAILR